MLFIFHLYEDICKRTKFNLIIIIGLFTPFQGLDRNERIEKFVKINKFLSFMRETVYLTSFFVLKRSNRHNLIETTLLKSLLK